MLGWLKAIREEKGFTQEEVARKIGTSQPTYCNIESGARNPSVKTAKQIAAALGFNWTRFFEDSPLCTGEKLAQDWQGGA